VAAGVLIVDDLAFVKLVLREIVEKAGFRVVATASDGEEAVRLFAEHHPEVVLLDITMPRMDGIAALREMRRIDPSSSIIMCSALGQQRLILQAIGLGARDFIVKPFKPERVVGAIGKALGIERATCAADAPS
jgi:two-component system, chemotaxis family, chemotaxis protein CheY